MKRRQILIRNLGKTMCLLLIIGGLVLGSSVALGGKSELVSQRPHFPTNMVGGTYHMDGENWLEGWTYRKSHIIQGSTTVPVTNYPIRLKVHYGSGTDSGKDVYLNGLCRPDFGDLRFTHDDGQTELDFWLEEKVDRNYARYWVEVTSIPASPSTTTIYVYYGNSGATTSSNGATTFQFFEPFNNFDSNKWRLSKNYVEFLQNWGYTIEDGNLVLYIGTRGKSKIYNGWFGTFYQYPFLLVDHALAIRMKAQKKNEGDRGEGYNIGIGFNDTSTNRTWGRGGTNEHKYTKGCYEMIWSSGTWDGSMTPYETRELRITASQVNVFHNGLYQFTETVSISGPQSIWIHIDVGDGYSVDAWGELYVDWVFLRNYVDPEPSHGAWGGEESEFPSVTVVSPNGGEVWSGIQSITWTATDPQADPLTYTVYYSSNGGSSWIQLAAGLTNPSYAWDTTTVGNGANYLVKVEAHDGTYTGPDVSNALFEIMNELPSTTTPETTTTTTTTPETTTTTTTEPPNMAPTVRIIHPNGGEQIHGMHEIQWSAYDPDGDTLTFTLSYSPNGGQTWTLIASGVTETSYAWDTSVVQVGDNYLIEVGASDEALSAVDQSDAPFTIARETPTTSPKSSFIPSFGLVEALGALLTLIGLGSWQRKRTG